MKLRTSIPAAAVIAALAAGPAAAATSKYVPGATDFPSSASTQLSARYVPGGTDFPSASYRAATPQAPIAVAAPGDGIHWVDAGLGAAVGAALGLGALGSSLLVRRRFTIAHS